MDAFLSSEQHFVSLLNILQFIDNTRADAPEGAAPNRWNGRERHGAPHYN